MNTIHGGVERQQHERAVSARSRWDGVPPPPTGVADPTDAVGVSKCSLAVRVISLRLLRLLWLLYGRFNTPSRRVVDAQHVPPADPPDD